MQKTLDIALTPDAAKVIVTHTVQNLNPWTTELAPWALSVMASGGIGSNNTAGWLGYVRDGRFR